MQKNSAPVRVVYSVSSFYYLGTKYFISLHFLSCAVWNWANWLGQSVGRWLYVTLFSSSDISGTTTHLKLKLCT